MASLSRSPHAFRTYRGDAGDGLESIQYTGVELSRTMREKQRTAVNLMRCANPSWWTLRRWAEFMWLMKTIVTAQCNVCGTAAS